MNRLLFGPRTLAITAVLVIAHVIAAAAAGLAIAWLMRPSPAKAAGP